MGCGDLLWECLLKISTRMNTDFHGSRFGYGCYLI